MKNDKSKGKKPDSDEEFAAENTVSLSSGSTSSPTPVVSKVPNHDNAGLVKRHDVRLPKDYHDGSLNK